MVLDQFLQKFGRPWITGIHLCRFNEALGGVPKLSLGLQRDAKILEGVRALAVDINRGATELLSFLELAQRVQRETEIVIDKVPYIRV